MQYLLTQEELDALKNTNVREQVRAEFQKEMDLKLDEFGQAVYREFRKRRFQLPGIGIHPDAEALIEALKVAMEACRLAPDQKDVAKESGNS